MQNSNSNSNLKKRLYQNLLNKIPKQNNLLGQDSGDKSSILKPKVQSEMMRTTISKKSPAFHRGKLIIQTTASNFRHSPPPNFPRSPQVSLKPHISLNPGLNEKLSKQGKAILQQGKLRTKANLQPHDIFAFYEAFPQMIEDFFYLNRITHPYHYQIVTYSNKNPNQYMTISSKGVTMYHDKQAEFMTKQAYIQDQKRYFQLQQIEFFRQYKISKNFTIWKNRMRRHYMKQMSNLLSQNLFLAYQHPRACLLETRKMTSQLKQQLYFMPSDSISAVPPQIFLKSCLSYIQHTFLTKISQIQGQISVSLQTSINQQLKKFKQQNNIKINDVGDHDQKDHKQGYVYSQEAILRKQYKRVNKLIKLTDNILIQSKIQLIHKCIQELLENIQNAIAQGSKQQWISCTAFPLEQLNSNDQNQLYPYKNSDQNNQNNEPQNKKVRWQPTMEGLKDIFRKIITQCVSRVNEEHDKIGNRQQYYKFKSNDQVQTRKDQKRNTLKYMIQDSSFYAPLVRVIQQLLEVEWKRTSLQQSQLSEFMRIYQKHTHLPGTKQLLCSHSAAQYCQLVREWKQQNSDMQLLPDNKSIGLLVFNYTEMRKKMISAPGNTLNLFLGCLPEETSGRCRELARESRMLLDMIGVYPNDIQGFVGFNQAVRKATERLDQLVDGGKELVIMVTLMEQNKLPNLDIYRGRVKQAMLYINNLKAKVDQSNAKYDQSLSKFKKQLQVNTIKVKSQVKQLVGKFDVIPFDNIGSAISFILQKLKQILPSIESLQKQSLTIQQIQSELSLPQSDFTQIHLLHNRSQLISSLWMHRKAWQALLQQIYNKHFTTLNCLQLKQKWQQFSAQCTKLQKQLQDNQVVRKLNTQINQFQNLVDTIQAMKSQNLQDKAWKQISQYLAYQLNVQQGHKLPFSNQMDQQYTVEWFINHNIALYKQKIIFIVQKSQKQKQLQTNLGQFRAYISTITFDHIIKKREVVLIQENLLLKHNLSQKLSILYSLIGNQYSQHLNVQAQTLIKHYQYTQQILSLLYNFRQQWQKYEPFFQPTSISTKLLSKQSKQFTSWQLQWKKIVKNITNDPVYFYRKVTDQTMGTNCSRVIVKAMIKANTLLDMVKKGLEDFVEKKKIQFPRYCILTDEQLTGLFALVDNRQLICKEIVRVLYQAIDSIQYEEESGLILSVTTKVGEKLPLLKQSSFKSQSEMEDILRVTEEQIKKTLSQVMRTTFNKYIEEEITREQLIKQNISQVALSLDYISWVRLAQQTYLITEPVGTLHDWLWIQQQQLKQCSILLKEVNTRQSILKVTQFIVQSLYFKQKTSSLLHSNTATTSCYQWQRIPKLIMSTNEIYLKMVDNKIIYNYQLLSEDQVRVITMETQRSWLALINAIGNKAVVGVKGQNTYQSIKHLAFFVGQSVKQISVSSQCDIKTFQRLLTGYLYIGSWLYFEPIPSIQILSYLSFQICSSKRMSPQLSGNLQLSKSSLFTSAFSSTVFLFSQNSSLPNLIDKNLIDHKCYRQIMVIKPDQDVVLKVRCQAEGISKELVKRTLDIVRTCREIFQCHKAIKHVAFPKTIINQLSNHYLIKFTHQEIANPQIIDYLILIMIQEKLSVQFSPNQSQLFQNLKLSILPNILILKAKLNPKLSNQIVNDTHPIQNYIKHLNVNLNQSFTYSKQYLDIAMRFYDQIVLNDKLGVIISGPVLGGKSQLIKFVHQAYKFSLKSNYFNFKSNQSKSKSNQSNIKSNQSTIKSNQFNSKSNQQTIKSNQSKIKSNQPTIKSNQSNIKFHQSKLKHDKSIYKYDQSSSKNDQSSSKYYQSTLSVIYPCAYNQTDLLKSNIQQKNRQIQRKTQKTSNQTKVNNEKAEKQKSQKVYQELGIIQLLLKQDGNDKWIILDGNWDHYNHNIILQFLKLQYDQLLIPNYGIISKQKYGWKQLKKVKFIFQTTKLSSISPQIFVNYSICSLPQNILSVQAICKEFFSMRNVLNWISVLSGQSLDYLICQVTLLLTRIQSKGVLTSNKQLQFLYPLNQNQITKKVLLMMESLFKMNKDTIRQKDKNMKKLIDRFVNWTTFVILSLHTKQHAKNKLQKRFVQIAKCDGMFQLDNPMTYIIYPGSGLQVNPVNGLRTQSSLFQIPQKGIITLKAKNDYNDFNNTINQKTNKFYEQICLEDIFNIRVNHEQSNSFSYYAQLFAYRNIPLILCGPSGSGKKSILDLYSKNIRHRSHVHSIRHHVTRPLIQLFEKPYRKFNSLNGMVLKSFSPCKSIVVFIQDISLNKYQLESLQFMRMLASNQSYLNKNGLSRRQTQTNNSIVLLSNRLCPDQQVLRFVTRNMFFSTAKVTSEKITSIYLPYLNSWAKANTLQGEVERIFTSPNGDGLIDATIKVYQFMEQAYKNKKAQANYTLETILLKPRIGDVSRILAFICRIREAQQFSMSYYSQLWSSQILRVFGDRLCPDKHSQVASQLLQLLKKESFIKFKQNTHITSIQSLLFSNMLSQDNVLYQRIQEMENVQQFIINLIDSQSVTVEVKLFFNQLVIHVMQIYRCIQLQNGNVVVLHPNPKVRKYLIQLASQIAQSNFIPLNNKTIQVQKDILTTIDLDENICIYQQLEQLTDNQLYQFTCLMNSNYYDYQMRAQTREKVKSKLSKYLRNMFGQISSVKQSTVIKSKQSNKQRETLYLNQKLQQQLEITMQQVFMNNVHFVFGANPSSSKIRYLLLNESDFVGELHFNYFHIPQESIHNISKQVLSLEETQLNQSDQESNEKPKIRLTQAQKKQKIIDAQRIQKKCMLIYNSLNQNDKNFNCLLSVCQNIINQKIKLTQNSLKRKQQLQKCLKKHENSLQIIKQHQQKLQQLQGLLEQIKKQQSSISSLLQQKGNQISEIQLSVVEQTPSLQIKQTRLKQKNLQFQKLQEQIRQIKARRDKCDQDTRQSRRITSLAKDFINIVGDKSKVQHELAKTKIQYEAIQDKLIIWYSLIQYKSKCTSQQTVQTINSWATLINPQTSTQLQVSKVCQIFNKYELILAPLHKNIPNLHHISDDEKLKLLQLFFIIKNQQQLTFSGSIISVYDPSGLIDTFFKIIPLEDQQFGYFSFFTFINNYDEGFWNEVQKNRKGLVILSQQIKLRQKYQIQKFLTQRRLTNMNRFVSIVPLKSEADISIDISIQNTNKYLKHACISALKIDFAEQSKHVNDQILKITKKVKGFQPNFKQKLANIDLFNSTDIQQLTKLKNDISMQQNKLEENKKALLSKNPNQAQKIQIKIIQKVISQFQRYNKATSQSKNYKLVTLTKIYQLIDQKIKNYISQIRKAKSQQNNASQQRQNSETQQKAVQQSVYIQQNYSNNCYSQDQLYKIDKLIEWIIKINFTNTISSSNLPTNICSLISLSKYILSTQTSNKVPLIILTNNLTSQSLISREVRAVNLLSSNISNLLLENSTDEKIHNKFLLFYNDQLNNSALNQLTYKYQNQWLNNNVQKKFVVYLFVEGQIHRLIKGLQDKDCAYQIYIYQINNINQVQKDKSQGLKQSKLSISDTSLTLRISRYFSLVQCLNKTTIPAQIIQQIIDYSQTLSDNKQIKKYLSDTIGNVYSANTLEILDKILNDTINDDQIQNFIHINQAQNNQQSQQKLIKQNRKEEIYVKSGYIDKKIVQQVIEQLPTVFNPIDYVASSLKDPLASDFQLFSKIYNKKIKAIKNLLEQQLLHAQLQTDTLKYEQNQYLLPSQSYILSLNKQKKRLKRILCSLGIIALPIQSQGKISSTKGLINSEQTNFLKNCISFEQINLNKRIINQLKIKATKKLKLPFKRIGLAWMVQRKGQMHTNVDKYLIQNTFPQITITCLSVLKHATLLLSKQQKLASQKLINQNKSTLKPNEQPQKQLRLLLIPYDNLIQLTDLPNSLSNSGPRTSLIKKDNLINISKKDEVKDKQRQKHVQTTRIPIFLQENQKQSLGQIIFPTSQVILDINSYLKTPKFIIKQILTIEKQ